MQGADGVQYIVDANDPTVGHGIVNEKGEDEIFPASMTPEQIAARIAEVSAASGMGSVFSEPVAAPTTVPATVPATGSAAPVAAPVVGGLPAVWPESTYTAPATAASSAPSSGGSSGGGESWQDWSNSGGGYPVGGSRSSSTADEDTARAFTADDFLDQADGDRTKAAAMAKAANRKRRTKRTKMSGRTSTMPTRAETPLRTAILAALNESMARRP